MSDFTTLARPYASAVYKLAVESSSLDSWDSALVMMAAIASDAEMKKVLDNPELSRKIKGEMFIKVLDDKLDEQQKNLARLMAENGRLKILPNVAEQYEVYRAEAEGTIDAEVVSAFPLSAEQETAITNTLKSKLGCDVTISTLIDESLIGGVVIKAGDTVIDGSMKSQLAILATALSR